MNTKLAEEILAYLENHNVMTLATTGDKGPWTSAVFYVNVYFNLYFFTEIKTRHGTNLAANSIVAAAIHKDYHDWREIKGIQLQGEAKPVGIVEKTRILALFTRKFLSFNDLFADSKATAIIARAQIYKLVPGGIWYLDNKKGFSSRQKLILDDKMIDK